MPRTTHRSTSGTKLYAKRKSGKFTDIQTYQRAHGQDVKRSSAAERAAAKTTSTKKKASKKTGVKKTGVKKQAAKKKATRKRAA